MYGKELLFSSIAFDPAIRFLHSVHIPYYVVVAFLVIVVLKFIVLIFLPCFTGLPYIHNVWHNWDFKGGMFFTTSWMYLKDGYRTRMEQRVQETIDLSLCSLLLVLKCTGL